MQEKNPRKFDLKQIEEFIRQENQFIVNLLSITDLPERRKDEDDLEEDDNDNTKTKSPFPKKTSRAKSLHELQERLQSITSKKKLTYKEKMTKKGLKNRMKHKSKQEERNAQQKLIRAAKTANLENPVVKDESVNEDEKPTKFTPTFNTGQKVVFSKFDFTDIGKKRRNKEDKDPKKLLKKLEEENTLLQKLEQSGDKQKVVEIKEKTAWKNALAKSEGKKVKDDTLLLKKTVKRQEQQKRSSKKKWEARLDSVKKAKDERQQKRTQNIEKRKKDKKTHKLKKAVKKGKVIPGY